MEDIITQFPHFTITFLTNVCNSEITTCDAFAVIYGRAHTERGIASSAYYQLTL